MNSKNLVTRIFWNYIYSGKEWDAVQSRQVSFVNGVSLVGVASAVGFGIYRILIGEIFGWVEVTLGLLAAGNLWYLRKSFNAYRASGMLLFLMIVMLALIFVDGGIAGTGIFWAFTFPVLAFFLFDDEIGLWWNIVLLSVMGLISLSSLFGVLEIHYHWVVLRQVLFSFLAVVGLLYFHTKFSSVNAKILLEKSRELKDSFNAEKEEIEIVAHKKELSLKEKLEIFFHTTGEIMGLGTPEGYFLEINPAFTKILGYTPEEVLKTPFMGFVYVEDFKNVAHRFAQVIQGEVIEDFSFRMKRKDGAYVWVMWNATFHEGMIYMVGHQVNDLVIAQETLQKKVHELEKLNQIMIDRELTMIEMKKELSHLKGNTL